jgi:flavin-dependent dehydrogenase
MYGAIVVGARCAGAPTAMLLARAGHRVLLVDRSGFPSDRHQGHFIHRQGPGLLRKWGLLERVVATGCPPVTTCTTDFGDCVVTARDVALDGVAWGYGPRRTHLDQVLVDEAVKAGVEFRPNFVVHGYLSDDGRVSGIRGRDSHGRATFDERARITIGADGRNSALARLVNPATYEETPPLTCWYFSYWSGVPNDGFEMYLRPRRVIFSFATHDGLFAIFVAWPIEEFGAVKADPERQFLQVLDLVPHLAGRVRAGKREERFRGTADLPNFFRRPFGPGWALVGDAGCHKDPFMALGICDAFRDADLLAAAIDEGLSGSRPLESTLAEFEEIRNHAAREEYRQNVAAARFQPLPPEVKMLRRAVAGNAEEARRWVMAREGMIPPGEFFAPENIARLIHNAGGGSAAAG